MKEHKPNFTVSEAAELLGVTKTTLRNWDKSGKLKPVRDPMNGYRLYKLEDITKLLQERRFGIASSEKDEQLTRSNKQPNLNTKLVTLNSRSLRFLARQMSAAFRDSMGGGLLERFEEITKILYAKLYAELYLTSPKISSNFIFKKNESLEKIYEKINHIYQEAIESFPKSLLNGHRYLGEDNIAIARVGKLLENIRLIDAENDVKGLIYEELIRNTFDKTDNQQFFTPRSVVSFMVDLAFSPEQKFICDPACGSGGFLIKALQLTHKKQKIIGFEVDKRMAWVAQMNVIMHGGDVNVVHYLNNGGSLSFSEDLKHLIPEDGFDLIITNPPFGSDFTDEVLLKKYELGQGKSSRRRGVLFIERCIKWLKEGTGKLAIIVDDSILNGKSNHDTRCLIFKYCIVEAVINLPEVTFKPYASVKTSILLLKRRNLEYEQTQPPIFMAEVEEVGRKANGDPCYKNDAQGNLILNDELPSIINAWKAFQEKGEKAIENLIPKVFICPAERFYDKSDQIKIDRLDVSYHHPSRSVAEKTLQRSQYPTPKLAELVIERNISVTPNKVDPYDLWRYIGLADISSKTGEYTISEVFGNQIKSAVKLFKGGDILFSKLRPELRKCILIEASEEDGYASAECFVFRVINQSTTDTNSGKHLGDKKPINHFEIDSEYLAILLRSDIVYGQLVYQISGTGRPRITKSAVLGVKIPLPPIEIQREIVTAHKIAWQNYLDSRRRSQEELNRGISFLESAFKFSSEKLCPLD